MIFYKEHKSKPVYMPNNKKYVAQDLAEAMNDVLINKVASEVKISNASDKLLSDLNRSSELFEDLGNFKAAEIITKLIEKIAGK